MKKTTKKDDNSTLCTVQKEKEFQLKPLRISLKKFERERKNVRFRSNWNRHSTSLMRLQTQDYEKRVSKSVAKKTALTKKMRDTIFNYKDKVTNGIFHQIKTVKSIVRQISQGYYVFNQRKKHLIIFILILISMIFSSFLTGLLQSRELTNSYGLTVQCISNDYTTIDVRDSISKTFFIKNNNKKPVILNFFTKNWDPPEAHDYIEISWNYDESPIPPGKTCMVVITVENLSTQKIYNFSFYIHFISQSVL